MHYQQRRRQPWPLEIAVSLHLGPVDLAARLVPSHRQWQCHPLPDGVPYRSEMTVLLRRHQGCCRRRWPLSLTPSLAAAGVAPPASPSTIVVLPCAGQGWLRRRAPGSRSHRRWPRLAATCRSRAMLSFCSHQRQTPCPHPKSGAAAGGEDHR